LGFWAFPLPFDKYKCMLHFSFLPGSML